jgi:hypothetical protein
MKYVIRRAIAGLVITPIVASAYWLLYASLVGLATEPSAMPIQVWNNGLMFGIISSVMFVVLGGRTK